MNDTTIVTRGEIRDPVCGMDVDPANPAARVEYEGTSYYFCSARCAETFRRDPEGALTAAPPRAGDSSSCCGGGAERNRAQPEAAAGAGKYICPMSRRLE
jgi:Cu+-exporting ATPase